MLTYIQICAVLSIVVVAEIDFDAKLLVKTVTHMKLSSSMLKFERYVVVVQVHLLVNAFDVLIQLRFKRNCPVFNDQSRRSSCFYYGVSKTFSHWEFSGVCPAVGDNVNGALL